MSKYSPLWKYIRSSGTDSLLLSFDQIQTILGFPIDHAFLTYRKELLEYGYQANKISIKKQTVSFSKIQKNEV